MLLTCGHKTIRVPLPRVVSVGAERLSELDQTSVGLLIVGLLPVINPAPLVSWLVFEGIDGLLVKSL